MQPLAKFVENARTYFPNAYYLTVSFVGAEAFARELRSRNIDSYAG